jgi:glutamate N-acetyltransferase/amino-acid N-acetyltransferase
VSVSFVPTDRSPVLPLLVNGEPEQVDEVRAKEILSAEDLEIRVDLGLGSESAKYWTCDFGYVSAFCCFVQLVKKYVFFYFC